jgi:hypothetical protein
LDPLPQQRITEFRRFVILIEQTIRKQWPLVPICATFGGVVALPLCVPPLSAQGKDANFRPQRVVDRFPPITEFPVKSVREAGDALNPSELIIGVTVGKEARAYPINMLTGPQREILNDTLGGKAIAATW